ncbi:MAG: HAMP domain-containing sensor histidine kinase [Alphaproteobacteria bacterium]|nr:HAMP domain-containing sensor histidine kinase [Alphaproteobacteria bacterium]
MTARQAVWTGLALLAAVWGLVLGVPFWLGTGALACALTPTIAGAFVRGSASEDQVNELETVLWVALATLGVASTGGAGSPLILLYAAAISQAWAAGRVRLVAETAGFCVLGYALASLASANGPWLDPEHAGTLAMVYGFSALVQIAALAVRAAALGRGGGDAPGPMSEPALALKLGQAERRFLEAEASERDARADANAARHALDARTRFFAQTSHELRTPLNAIIGFADMMKNAVYGPLPPKYREYAGLIHEGGQTLEIVVDDVLDLSRIEAGRYEIAPDLVSLTDLCADAVRFMADMAERKKIALTLQTDGDVEAFADSRAVRQIALNLVSNALKFTPEGGQVTVAALASAGGALLAVSDTGAGIGAEELVRLSRAYEQGDEGRKQKGAGLGLSVVRAFAELHGGRLDIESRKGGGSTIAVYFPGAPEMNPPDGETQRP